MSLLPYAAVALLLLPPALGRAVELDPAAAAVVKIVTTRDGAREEGSGFVVSLDRDQAMIVTASHVVEGPQKIEVSFAADQTHSFLATVRGLEATNPNGLALLQVSGTLPKAVTALRFETAEQPRPGVELVLWGFPQRATRILTVRRGFAGPSGNLLQLDQPSGTGFSGAPVLRLGKVVGVVVTEDERYTYAVRALVAQGAVTGWGISTSPQEAGVTELKTPDGSYRKQGDRWVKYPPSKSGQYFMYQEQSRDKDYVYLIDRSRHKPGSPGNAFILRLPLHGGAAEWSYQDPVAWKAFLPVLPAE